MSEQQDFDPRDRKRYSLEETPTRRLLLWLIRNLFHTAMVMRIEGQENLPLDGPVIVAANHVTNFDVFPVHFAASKRYASFLTDRLMFTLAAGLPESMRGVYAEIPKGFGRSIHL